MEKSHIKSVTQLKYDFEKIPRKKMILCGCFMKTKVTQVCKFSVFWVSDTFLTGDPRYSRFRHS
jgi:hypothetical protein